MRTMSWRITHQFHIVRALGYRYACTKKYLLKTVSEPVTICICLPMLTS